MSVGRGEVVGKLRGLTAVLARGSERAEDGCSGGSTAGLGSPALRVERRRVLGRRRGEQAKGRTEWGTGVLVVLVRALGEGGGLCIELATAAARWRPRGRLWARRGAWHGRGSSSARKGGRWDAQARRVEATRSRRWLVGGPPRRRRCCTAQRRRETEQGSWRKGKRTQTQFLKFPGTIL